MRTILLLLLLTASTALAGSGPLALAKPQWSPRNLIGVAGWWDGFYGATGTISLADISVASGGDPMAAASHQPTLVANQLNGWQVVHFTNSQYANTTAWRLIGQNWHFWWVGRVSNPTAAQCVANTTTNTQVVCFTAANVMSVVTAGAQNVTSTTAPTTPGTFSLLEVKATTGVVSFRQNQTDLGKTGAGVQTTAMAFNSLGMVLSSAAFMNGDMATVFYTSASLEGTMAQAYAQEYCRRRFKLY